MKHQTRHLTLQLIWWACIAGVTAGIVLFALPQYMTFEEYVEVAYAGTEEVESQEVRIKIVYDWTEETIIEEIHKMFPDAPIMVRVAKCEGVVNGKLSPTAFNPTNNSNDTGIFQISDRFHRETYLRLGFTDMTDVKQNLAYARILYDESGLQPWSASKHCWLK